MKFELNIYILLAIILVCFLSIGILVGFCFYLYLKNKENKTNKIETSSSDQVLKLNEIENNQYCLNHSQAISKSICIICEANICEDCTKSIDNLVFCPEHLKTYAQSEWSPITDIKTTPQTPQAAIYVYEFKKKIWKEKSTPSFIKTHYKINFEGDHIESYVKLYVRESEKNEMMEKIKEEAKT